MEMKSLAIATFVLGTVIAVAPLGLANEAHKLTGPATSLKAPAKAVRARLSIEGIFCSDCLTHIDAALKKLPGYQKLEIDPATGEGFVSFDPSLTDRARVLKAINDTAYKAKWL